MVFKRDKYGFFSMAALYLKIAPAAAGAKIAYYILKAALPTVSIYVNAQLVNSAVDAATGNGKLTDVVLPLALVVCLLVFRHYAGTFTGLLDLRSKNRLKKELLPAIAERKASVKFRYFENREDVDVMNRALDGLEEAPMKFFDQIFNVACIAAELVGFAVVLGLQLWWVTLVFIVTFVPSFIISYRYGETVYRHRKG